MAEILKGPGTNPDWSKLIYTLRERHNVSQRGLAKMAGLNRSTLRRMEAGVHLNNGNIAKVLGVLGYELATCVVRKRGDLGKPETHSVFVPIEDRETYKVW
jgi:transcriptional regulator with XRE-family HTH domain